MESGEFNLDYSTIITLYKTRGQKTVHIANRSSVFEVDGRIPVSHVVRKLLSYLVGALLMISGERNLLDRRGVLMKSLRRCW